MSLIKCPECGKENVSDSAEACPNCGYGIKAHFDKIESHEKQKKLTLDLLEQISLPNPPQKHNEFFSVSFLLCGATILSIIINEISLNVLFILIGITITSFLIAFILREYVYKQEYKKYDWTQKNFEQYQNEELAKINIQQTNDIKIQCPYCKSMDTTRISMIEKAGNIALFGLLGNKRKYQWHCNNCKSNF